MPEFTDQEKDALGNVFTEVDANADGKVTHNEVKQLFNNLGHRPTDAAIQKIIENSDTDKTGSISFSEFTASFDSIPEKDGLLILWAAHFRTLDKDGSGKLGKDEIKAMLEAKGTHKNNLDEMINKMDITKDGQISFAEFKLVMLNALTDQENDAFYKVFREVDADGDGNVTHDEIKQLFNNLGHRPTDASIQKIIENSDKNKTGSISFTEFTASFDSIQEKDRLLILWAAQFRTLDKDGSGKLGRNEIKAMLQADGACRTKPENDDEIIDKMDITKDGQISFAEFKLVMLNELTDKENDPLYRVFTEVDTNSDGKITHDEIKQLFKNLGHRPSDEDIRNIIENSDKNNTGSITFNEFTASFDSIPEKDRLLILWAAQFRALDKDGSGKLERNEVKTMLQAAGGCGAESEKDFEKLINKMDITKDGKISFAEFKLVMLSTLNQPKKEEHIALLEVFKQVDANSDGLITHDEIKQLFTNLGHRPTDVAIKKIIENSDKNNTGSVNFADFTASFDSIPEKDRLLIMWAAQFRALDIDGSGKLDRDEIKAMLEAEGGCGANLEKDIDKIINKMDITMDGQISFAEFKLAMLDTL